jgi:hypothetical protein
MTPDGTGDDLLMILQVALLPVCWWAAGRIGEWLAVRIERWHRRHPDAISALAVLEMTPRPA